MSELELRQFKTTSGEEVICEVMQWAEGYESEVLVKNAMKLVLQEPSDGVKYYSFRPWMVYQEHPDDIIVLNMNNVVGIGFPPETLLEQYFSAVADMSEVNAARELEFNKSFDEETQKGKREKVRDKVEEYLSRMDSGNNIINLFDPNKIH